MNPLPISLPPGAELVSHGLFDSKDPAYLTEDLVLVSLPAGTFIDVSWKPELDPDGSYVVTVYRDSWDNQLSGSTTRDPFEALEDVEKLAVEFSRPVVL